VEDVDIEWNFEKFMIDEAGCYAWHGRSGEQPVGEKMLAWLGV
jgi:glutathione peroxidase-family protein